MPDIPIGIPQRVPDEVANYFYNMYPDAFKRGKRPQAAVCKQKTNLL